MSIVHAHPHDPIMSRRMQVHRHESLHLLYAYQSSPHRVMARHTRQTRDDAIVNEEARGFVA